MLKLEGPNIFFLLVLFWLNLQICLIYFLEIHTKGIDIPLFYRMTRLRMVHSILYKDLPHFVFLKLYKADNSFQNIFHFDINNLIYMFLLKTVKNNNIIYSVQEFWCKTFCKSLLYNTLWMIILFIFSRRSIKTNTLSEIF